MTQLFDVLKPERLTSIVDVGAHPVDGAPVYAGMLQQGYCDVIGFEPQLDGLSELTAKKTPHETYLPYCLGTGSSAVLKVCSVPGMTSLLEPDPARLKLFKNFEAWGSVVRRQGVQTKRLDDVEEIVNMDLLRMDVQGSELAIMQGGLSKLRDVVAVHLEVSFVPLYKNQPCFGELDVFLRGFGFIPHLFSTIKGCMLNPMSDQIKEVYTPSKQLLEADVLYVRDFNVWEVLPTESLKHLAMLGHYCFGNDSIDLVVRCLTELVSRVDSGVVVPPDSPFLTWIKQADLYGPK